jgi:N6-L-threonylcarbamoyladenine synthase
MRLILGVETSCDETAASVVGDGREIRSNVVASQVDIHRRFGGVFPEVASRQHVLDIVPVIEEAMANAGVTWNDLDTVAVTNGPGLVGSLLVGANAAKSIAWARGLPLVGVNHLEAHLYANWLYTAREGEEPPAPPAFPALCLIVSGGHTDLVWMTDHGKYRVLGRTLDDAAGEAFDKVARLLGLGYPGGPAVQKASAGGNPTAFDLPRAIVSQGYDFSFSGLKTAVLHIAQGWDLNGTPKRGKGNQEPRHGAPARDTVTVASGLPLADLAASFQAAVVDVLVQKTKRAAEEFGAVEVLLAGGVASNALLRQEMSRRLQVKVRYPPPSLCTDNAAMVASAGFFQRIAGDVAGWELDVQPGKHIHEATQTGCPECRP